MKKVIILLILIVSMSVQAQRNVEQSFPFKNNKDLFVNFKFASDIKIEQWNKDEVLVKATVQIDDGEGNEFYSIKSANVKNELRVYSDFGNYYKERSKNHYINYDCKHRTTEISYTLYVPNNAKLKIKSISGSVQVANYKGDLSTDLISGDVTIGKYDGALNLKTISGDLDVAISKATVRAKTLTGTIYTNHDIKMENSYNRNDAHNRIAGDINNGGERVRFETISGNVYMRKL